MSTSVSSATLFPAWKQEVNRRVAAHLSQKTTSSAGPRQPSESKPAAGRAARAAARVAERYAHAPSYSEMLAGEARAAARAAQAASKAALEAHAAVQYVLAGLEAVSMAEPAVESEAAPDLARKCQVTPIPAPAPQILPQPVLCEASSLSSARVEPTEPARLAGSAPSRARAREQVQAIVDSRAAAWQEPVASTPVAEGADHVQAAEAAQPIYANLIEFPREMVATRKMRPRRAEGPLAAAASQAQLSIFEVDPGTISTQPAALVEEPVTPTWMRTELTSIAPEPQLEEDLLEEPAPKVPLSAPLELAPLSRRLLAIVVDVSLIVMAFLAAVILIAFHVRELPAIRTVERGAALALLAVVAVYQTLFFTLAKATPGMRYAGIALSTFEGYIPSRAQRCGRLMALLLSALPLGLGLVWSLFDDGRLTWHDRLSKTYLRRR
ncbi:MAG: RDD family protein [Terracidiphilus sp.]